jgi:hypothetical protein
MDNNSATMPSNDKMSSDNAENRGVKRPAEDGPSHNPKRGNWSKEDRKAKFKGDRKGKGKNLGRGEYL